MKDKCLDYKWEHKEPIAIDRLVGLVGDSTFLILLNFMGPGALCYRCGCGT